MTEYPPLRCQIKPCEEDATHRLSNDNGTLGLLFVPNTRSDDVPHWCQAHGEAIVKAADASDRGGKSFFEALEALGGVDLG